MKATVKFAPMLTSVWKNLALMKILNVLTPKDHLSVVATRDSKEMGFLRMDVLI